MPAIDLKPLPPAEAIGQFRSKGQAQSFAWQDVWQEEHARAFTVAKAMSDDVLTQIRGSVDQALAEGTTFEQFRDGLKPKLVQLGWWGKAAMTDPATGETRPVQLGSDQRLRTIFDTNLRVSLQAGRWQRFQETAKTYPYLRYVAVMDGRTRPQHRAWHGTILPLHDPWWDSHYPPCGWRCRCTAEQVNQRTMDRFGWSPTDKPIAFPPKTWRNPRTDQIIVLEQGIDPGFAYNPGKAFLDGITPRPGPKPGPGSPGGAPVRPSDPRPPLPPPRPGPAPAPAAAPAVDVQSGFLRAFGGGGSRPVVFTDPGGEPFVAGPALFKAAVGSPLALGEAQIRALPLAARAIRYPDEIRTLWAGAPGRERLTRRSIARIAQAGGPPIGVAVDVVAGGAARGAWSWSSGLEAGFDLEALRTGALSWRRTLSADFDIDAGERAALSAYTGPGHGAMNAWLRYGDRPSEAVLGQVATLQGLLRRAELPRDMILWRVLPEADLKAWVGDGALAPGQVIHDDGFLSASRDPIAAARFGAGAGASLRIIARAGARGLDVSELSSTASEHEILFAGGQALRLLHWDHDARVLTVELVP